MEGCLKGGVHRVREVALTAMDRGMPEVSLLMYSAHCNWRKSQLS